MMLYTLLDALTSPRLLEPANAGTVIPCFILAIILFITAACTARSSTPVVPAVKSTTSRDSVAGTDEQAGAAGVEGGTAENLVSGKEAGADSPDSVATAANSKGQQDIKSEQSTKAGPAPLFVMMGWGCLLGAVVLSAPRELKFIIGILLTILLGIVVTMNVDA